MTDRSADPSALADRASATSAGSGGEDSSVPKISPLLHIVAPLAALAATWVVRSAVTSAYKRTTGHEPPSAEDPTVSLPRVFAWTIAISASAAVTEMLIYRYAAKRSARRR